LFIRYGYDEGHMKPSHMMILFLLGGMVVSWLLGAAIMFSFLTISLCLVIVVKIVSYGFSPKNERRPDQ
jgi:hypothetical protein